MQGKAADYLAYLNELVPNLPYYDLIMQMKQFMESQDLFDPQLNQWHRQRTFNNHTDCSYTFTPNSQDTDYQSSLYCIQTMGTQHQPTFQEPNWQCQEQFISYRGSQDDSYSPFDISGDNAMVHSPYQKIKMLSEGEPVLEEVACPQVPPVAAQFNREPRRHQRGKYELYRGSRQGSISSKHQVELGMTSLKSKTELPSTECKAEKIIAGSMEKGLASLESKSEKLIMEPPAEQLQNVTSLLPLPGEGRGIQIIPKDSMSIEEIEEQLWPEPIELQSVQGHSLEVHPKIQESNSEINDFWWDSGGSKGLRPEDKNENPKSCEEYIDCMYNQLFASSNINTEALSTSQQYKEWIDQTFKETFYSTPLPKLYDQDESIQEEELTMEKLEAAIERFYPMKTRSPAQQEQTNIFCSDLSVEMPSLQDVQPYTAWNPSISLEGHLSSEQVEKTTGEFTICQISPPSSLILSITLQDRSIKAVVDTAAMVTVISDEIYRGMKPNPPFLKATSLQTAGRDMKMAGRIVGPLFIKLGTLTFPAVVHVAPINNDMLLGLDFLLKIGANINLKELYLRVTGATLYVLRKFRWK